MKLFRKFSESGWRKVIVHTRLMDWKDFDLFAWTVVDEAADMFTAPLFFARYTGSSQSRIEIKIQTEEDDKRLHAFFSGYAEVFEVKIESSGGSDAHAAAYELSRLLRGKGEPLTKDVLHWLLNMTGYSYPQEIRLFCEEASQMADNLEKLRQQ